MSGGMRYGPDENGNIRGVPFGGGGGGIGDIVLRAVGQPRDKTLACDGSEVSRESYEELFAVIGTMYGAGDGTTTFNLPDYRDRWGVFAGTTHETGENVEEGLPNITGGSSVAGVTENFAGYGAFRTGAATAAFFGTAPPTYPQHNFDFDASRSSAVYGASDHVTPASVTLYPCIIYEI